MKKSSYCADIASETLPNVFSRETRKREPLFYDESYDNISGTLGTKCHVLKPPGTTYAL